MSNETRRILLVEDEKAIRDAVTAYLERENYWVTAVGDGQELLEAGDLEHRDMGHESPFPDAGLLVHHLAKEGGGLEFSLHQELGPALAHQFHRPLGAGDVVAFRDDPLRVGGEIHPRGDFPDLGRVAYQEVVHQALGGGVPHRLQDMGVVGGSHRRSPAGEGAGPLGQLFKVFQNHGKDLPFAPGTGEVVFRAEEWKNPQRLLPPRALL